MDTLERAATLVSQYRFLEAYELVENADLDSAEKSRQLEDIAKQLRDHFERYAPIQVTMKHENDKTLLHAYQLLIDRDYYSARQMLSTLKTGRGWLKWLDQVQQISGEVAPPGELEDDELFAVKVIAAFFIGGGLLATFSPFPGFGIFIAILSLPVGWYVTQRRFINRYTSQRHRLNRILNDFLKVKLYSILISTLVFFASLIAMIVFASNVWKSSGVGLSGLIFVLSGCIAIWCQRLTERLLKKARSS